MENIIRDARVLVVVKAYPNPSKSHKETVCTAGLLNGETWIRIYPVSYRYLDSEKRFPKYGWINLDLTRRDDHDFRPESYRPTKGNQESFRVDNVIDTTPNGWKARRRFVLREVFASVDELIEQSQEPKNKSIGVVKPEVISVNTEEVEREWDAEVLASLKEQDLFDNDSALRKLRKVPYKFYYTFTTADRKERRLMIEDWEIGQLYWNCLKGANGDEQLAVQKVKDKLINIAQTKDMHFILGTTWQFHNKRMPNPFVIIGLFYPPFDLQEEFDFTSQE